MSAKKHSPQKEMALYMFFGVLASCLDFLVFGIMIRLVGDDRPALANIPAFITSVTVSFLVNKKIVFCSHDWRFLSVLREAFTFYASRILSFGLEEMGLSLSVHLFHLDDYDIFGKVSAVWIAKFILSISVALLNYGVGKHLVFQRKTEKEI